MIIEIEEVKVLTGIETVSEMTGVTTLIEGEVDLEISVVGCVVECCTVVVLSTSTIGVEAE